VTIAPAPITASRDILPDMLRAFVVASLLVSCTPPAGPAPVDTTPTATPPAASGGAVRPDPPPAPFARDDRPAVAAALKASGVELDASDCLVWPTSFPRVVVVGAFAHDRGCDRTGVFVDRRWYASDGDAPALATRDFTAARLADKEAIARAYVDEVVHAFGHQFVTEPAPAFGFPDSPKYAPVIARENKLGGVVVEGWEAVPPGMNDESAYVLATHRFAPDGALTSETKQQFAVDGDRLRQPPKLPSFTVDMSTFDLTCTRDADCTTVRINPCGPCGCSNTPLATRDLAAFNAAAAAIACPPLVPLPGGAGCGGCLGHRARCDAGKCVAKSG